MLDRLLTCFVASFFLFFAVFGLFRYSQTADIWRLGNLVEHGGHIESELLDRFEADGSYTRALSACLDETGRAVLSIRLWEMTSALFVLDGSKAVEQPADKSREATKGHSQPAIVDTIGKFSRSAVLDQQSKPEPVSKSDVDRRARILGETVKERLRCHPTDGNAWLIQAQVDHYLRRSIESIDNYVRISYWLAPSEYWIIEKRVALQAPRYEQATTQLIAELGSDIWRLVARLPVATVAQIYVATGIRTRAYSHRLFVANQKDDDVRSLRQLMVWECRWVGERSSTPGHLRKGVILPRFGGHPY